MPYEEEIVGLLREIKEQDKVHYEQWQKAITESQEHQKKAMESARKTAKKLMGIIVVILGLMIILLFSLSGTFCRLFTGCR